jgi:hypothetical protein
MFVARWIACWIVRSESPVLAVKEKPPCHAGYDARPEKAWALDAV